MSCAEILWLCRRVLFHLCLRGYATDWGHGIREAKFLAITDKEYRLKFLCNVNTLFVSGYFKNAVRPTGISKIVAGLWFTDSWLPKPRITSYLYTGCGSIVLCSWRVLFTLDCYFLINFQTTPLRFPMHLTLCSTQTQKLL